LSTSNECFSPTGKESKDDNVEILSKPDSIKAKDVQAFKGFRGSLPGDTKQFRTFCSDFLPTVEDIPLREFGFNS
jgi:hypothetical protein